MSLCNLAVGLAAHRGGSAIRRRAQQAVEVPALLGVIEAGAGARQAQKQRQRALQHGGQEAGRSHGVSQDWL